MAVTPGGPRARVIDAADAATAAVLTSRTPSASSLPDQLAWVAFTIIHDARSACFLQINQWRDGVDLVQHYLAAPLDRPEEWAPVAGGAIGCVWELPVIAHERDAWVEHVLSPSPGPDLQAYLVS